MNEESFDSLIPYDEIVQEALRAVVGRVLGSVQAEGGLPGDHHFYITFKTQAAGVDVPAHLLARFPDEMTIVIQNRYWDLMVEDDHFSIGLAFGGVPANLVVPYAAITNFVDPSVHFALQFEAQFEEEDELEDESPQEKPSLPEAKPIEEGSNVVSVDFTRKK
ncbi:MAG: ClpXP protease specificity-enhancing factor SspB [Zymomonas mobilis subsp. pomaceae]|uniref:Stringent starvation protein B n=1 Tax=Zymomonas mobilis subsp. pomaceae (strain ATCC 29192 / DSM 22645 / JCM 10191 / CCUG 17912 / NBRC 13757 / NCIMB 11200 / NRRL B-4491 / Barker I) TaxID=579138 RepID=F8EW71_ZYMMT|nr:ClpXP protease specificity-enhancing factor SspB [Zymomonas mobilis]AEI38481.1 protein of unknown function DUF1321 [Zymomonas mobilis subsp. pomaceae ATCC 29192]MDX5948170.1 ClpXP protease specificity-enhancing factor SspB [Zymomonas mobilis subsp. pomaceae]GEB89890.1 hypothetical protein ZMO02_15270 [Zymomonas mobilis subsp. pomaceae]